MGTDLVETFISQGRLSEAANELTRKALLSPREQVLKSYLSAEIDGARFAETSLQHIDFSRLLAREKALCLDIQARAAAHSGEISKGITLLQRAIETLAQPDHYVLQTRAETRLLTAILNWVGIEPAVARLAALRRKVIKAGDPFSTISLHLLMAEIDMKMHHWGGANSHLAVADHLLVDNANLVQQARLTALRSNLYGLRSRPAEAHQRLAGSRGD